MEEEEDPVQSAQRLVARGELSAAFTGLVELPDSPGKAALLVECAYELNTLDAAATACQAVDRLDAGLNDPLPTTRRFTTMLDALRAAVLVQGQEIVVPRSWVEWFRLTNRRRPLAVSVGGPMPGRPSGRTRNSGSELDPGDL